MGNNRISMKTTKDWADALWKDMTAAAALSDCASLLSGTEDGEVAAMIEKLQRTPWPSSMMQEAATMLTRLSARVKELEAPHTRNPPHERR